MKQQTLLFLELLPELHLTGLSFNLVVSGASAGTGNSIAQTLTATGTSPGTVTYTITPTANGCDGTPIDVIITVNPTPDVTANPSSETICSDEATNIALSGTVTGTTFNWDCHSIWC